MKDDDDDDNDDVDNDDVDDVDDDIGGEGEKDKDEILKEKVAAAKSNNDPFTFVLYKS